MKTKVCEVCGYNLPQNGGSCRVCRNSDQWEDYKDAELESLFSRRISKNLQDLNISVNEDDLSVIKSGKGLFLFGDAGSGKTLYSCAVAFEYLRRCFIYPDYPKEPEIKFVSIPNLLEEIKASFSNNQSTQIPQRSTNDILEHYSNLDFLILDDLGTEQTTDWSLNILRMIINNRYENLLRTIITSNLDLEELSVQVDDRVSSRISEMCQIIDFGDYDYRLNPIPVKKTKNTKNTKNTKKTKIKRRK
ncbi:MAG TPA: ATP-binding protein [Bacteroidales bacterium]|nr:ATP-binding protein [Bacteroidales bacterium]